MKNIGIKVLLAVVSVLLAALVCIDVWILSRATNGFETSLFAEGTIEEEEEEEAVDFEITRDAVLRDTFRDDDGYIEDVFYYDNFCLYCEGVCEGHTRYTTESGLQYNFRPEYVEIDLGQGDAFEVYLVFKDRPAKDDLYFNSYPRCIEARGENIDFSSVYINQNLRYYLTEDPGEELEIDNTDEWKYCFDQKFVDIETESDYYYYVKMHYRAEAGEYETDIDYPTTREEASGIVRFTPVFEYGESFHDGKFTLYMTGDKEYSYDFYLDTDEEYPELGYESATVDGERIENSNKYYLWHTGYDSFSLPKNLPTHQYRAAAARWYDRSSYTYEPLYFCVYDSMQDVGTGFESFNVYSNVRCGDGSCKKFITNYNEYLAQYAGWAEDIEWGGFDYKSWQDIGYHTGAYLEDTYSIRDGELVFWNYVGYSDTVYYNWISYQPNWCDGMRVSGQYTYPENYIITYDMAGNEKIYLLRLN